MTNEWTKEIETMRARVAALEAALKQANGLWREWREAKQGSAREAAAGLDIGERLRNALSGGTSALDAAVAAAVAARVAAIRARVEALYLPDAFHGNVVPFNRALDQALSAIAATEGGAP